MKKADVVLGVAVLVFCAVWLGIRLASQREGAYALVKLDGQVYGRYALDEDQEIDIGSGNHIAIEDGTVRMADADCPDRICVRQGRISAEGALITCMPNRVTVQVQGSAGEDEGAPDAIAY